MILGKAALHVCRKASDEERALRLQAPLLLQMQSLQSGRGIDISVYEIVVTAVNTINNIRERNEKSWWNGPMGLIVIGVG